MTLSSAANIQGNGDHHHYRLYTRQRNRHYIPTPFTKASLKGCCCCIFLLLVFIALLALAITLVLILVVKPKKPEFQLRHAAVSYLIIAQSAPSAAYLTLNISVAFAAKNPNMVGIKYESTGLYFMYRGVPLGTGSVPGFEQPAHSSRLIETRVVVSRVNVLQADAIELVRDAVVDDRVKLRVLGDVGAKIIVLRFTSPKVQVSVDCGVMISPKKQSVVSTQCGVDGVNV